MKKEYKDEKTLGPVAALLVTTLNERNHYVFSLNEAEEILKGHSSASNLLSKLVKKGIVTRLKSGLFRLVPFELGTEKEYLGNPYIVAREIALISLKQKKQYYLSHGSAFHLHQMITQPQFIVYTSCPKILRSHTILGTEFRFVCCKEKDIFGITDIWVDNNEKVQISDLERTLLDGLKQPDYCGGMSEVAKAFWIKRELIDPQKLIDYALKLEIGAVIRRLGYIMELYQIGSRIHWEFLQTKLTNTYQVLDPAFPAEGRFISKWRLNLNIPEEELLALRDT